MGLLLGLTVQNSSVLAAGQACDSARNGDPVIAAFRDWGRVHDEVARLTSDHWEPGCIFVVRVAGSCGVVGCGSTFLVGQGFTSKGANPQSITVMADVHSDPRDQSRISSPRLVKIAPVDAIIVPSAWALPCSDDGAGSETTAGLRACLDEKVASQQSRLDGVLRNIRATMSPAGHQLDPDWSEKRLALFDQSQKAWEAYRAAVCEATYYETFPGSFATLHRLECLYRATHLRAGELMGIYFPED